MEEGKSLFSSNCPKGDKNESKIFLEIWNTWADIVIVFSDKQRSFYDEMYC